MKEGSEMEKLMQTGVWYGLNAATATALLDAGAESSEDVHNYIASGASLTKLGQIGDRRAKEILKWLDDKPLNHKEL